MAQYSLESASIIANGTTLRLIFPAASWSTPTVDVSSVYLVYERSNIDIASGFDHYRRVVIDSATVLGSGKVQVDCHCTGNNGTTNSARNPMHDGHSNIRVQFDADIVTEGADGTNAETAFSVTATSVATGPVFQTATIAKPSRTYDPTDLATGSPTGSMSILTESTTVARPGVITAGVDISGLTVPGVADPYLSGHFEWEVTDTSNNPITEYALDSLTDPVFGGSLHPYSDFRGPELRCAVWADETVRVKCTGYWKTASGEVSASATQDITVRDIEWAVDYWVDSVDGDAGNDGLDPWGLTLTAGTYDPGTRTLTQAGKFTNYDHTAATAPTEPWKKYNYIYMLGGTFQSSAGTPEHWIKNEFLESVGDGGTFTSWTNSGVNSTAWTTATTETVNLSSQGEFYAQNTITAPDTPSAGSFTFMWQFVNWGANLRNNILRLPSAMNVDHDSGPFVITFYGSTTTETFTTTSSYGDFAIERTLAFVFEEGSGSGGTFRLFINGEAVELTDGAAKTGTSITTDDDSTAAPSGAWVIGTGNQRTVEAMVEYTALSDAELDEWFGYFAWNSNSAAINADWNDALPSGHAYETSGPVFSGLLEIESKASNDAVVLASGQTLGAVSGITTSTGPKADGTNASADTRCRVKAGSSITTPPVETGSLGNKASILVYGDGRATLGTLGTQTDLGISIGGVGTVTKDHYFVTDFDFLDTLISFSAAGNSGAGTAVNNIGLHNLRCSMSYDGTLLLATSAPAGTDSKLSGVSLLGSYFDAAGTVATKQIFTDDGATSGSTGVAADFGFGLVGSLLANNSSNATLDHHIYPSGFADHRLYSLGRFGEYGNGNYNINTNAGGSNDGITDDPNKYVTYWRNEFSNSPRGIDLSNINNTRIERGGTLNPFDSVVISECSFHDLSQQAILYYCSNNTRIAHCEFWDIGDSHIRPDDSLSSVVAHNNVHTKASSDGGAIVRLSATWTDDDTVSRKATLRWQDDVVTDNRTQPEVLRCDVTKFTSSITNGSDISNITVYVPNDTSGGEIIYNTATTSYMTVAAFETATGLSDTFNIVGSAPANPTISNITPADNATGVLASQVVSIQFDETVKYLDGSVLIEVYQSGVVVASDRIDNGTINASDRTQWSIGNLLAGLADGAYSIRIASGGFGSIATSLPFAGITDDTTWNFTVGALATAAPRSRDRSRTR